MASAISAPGKFDRLSSTLFVAILAHGVVILGVTFAPEPPADPSEMPTINVTLLADTNELTNDPVDSSLLADRNQAGTSEGEGQRPTRTLTARHPLNQQGEPLGADDLTAEALEAGPPADQLVTRNASDREIEAVPETTDTAAPVPRTAAALLQQDAPDSLAAEIDDETRGVDSNDAEVNAPSTRQSAIARYLVGWRQRVERVGTANFPADFLDSRQGLGRPVTEVSIDAGGDIVDIVLKRSSGDTRLDQAAMQILELAGPFEPLPEAILAEADVLRFAYEWDFSTGAR